ncbi:hypothetical protein A1O1_08653 [Capronia coronata CBS 617.96]|uniref:Ribonucleases P/MRP subunit Pop8-like domain-containing protein n=1 Tax=Capronia coronata CBS 617.96 TaxID=1182541 RepID=W9XJY5_9EURO|nr:uncharacterized protein A1O1_08653 [Capronia coronata CBS 617.96]EXJ80508.1 hypothetical protein A1O1_08653 [Capronia coronata CBS 617.96]
MAPTTTKSKSAPRQANMAFTIRKPPYTYLHLSLLTVPSHPTQPLDEVGARSYLFAALQQYLGLTGTAVPIDILKVEDSNVWIRVPREDEIAVTAALSQWVGARGVSLRIEARGSWLGGVLARKADKDAGLWTMEA